MSLQPRAARRAAALVIVSAVCAGCDLRVGDGNFNVGLAQGRAEDEWNKSYPLAAGGRFEVRNGNGEIVIEPSDEQTVQVRAQRRARASSDENARAVLKDIRIEEQISQSAVVLETKGPTGIGRKGYEVRYFIKVPRGVQVRARTTNGGVRLDRLPNDVVAETENGGIRGQELSGAVQASTTNGGVDVTLAALAPGGVKLETVNGGVALGLPRSAKADISARCVNGGLSAGDLPVETVGEQSRRRLEGRLNGGGARVELSTTNGGIRLNGRG